jgi:hypothetical protein
LRASAPIAVTDTSNDFSRSVVSVSELFAEELSFLLSVLETADDSSAELIDDSGSEATETLISPLKSQAIKSKQRTIGKIIKRYFFIIYSPFSK